MSVLENFKNIPRSPYGGRQGSNVIFFLPICNEVPGGKKKEGACRPPNGRQGGCRPPLGRPLGPAHGRGRGACRPPNGRQAPVAHPSGDQPVGLAYEHQGGRSPLLRATGGAPHGRPGQAAYIRPPPHSLLSFDLKKSKKIQKKREG